MIAAFDCETRGLFGEIFRIGYYDNENGYQNFYTMEEFISHIFKVAENLPDVLYINRAGKEKHRQDTLNIYAFNLEFDLSKLLEAQEDYVNKVFNIEFSNSLIINGRFHTCKLADKNIVFRDIFPIVLSSLADCGKTFELTNFKQDLRTDDKDKYFKAVHPDDPELLSYLKADVLSTFELVEKIKGLSGLNEENFVKCPTVASLTMRIFRTNFADDYEVIKKSVLKKHHEEFVREGYFGGRTEVFKPLLNGSGYHYDVNSLYPSVMEVNDYPAGESQKTADNLSQETLAMVKGQLDKKGFLYMIKCAVSVPEQHIPPLPYRTTKLLFPIGEFSNTFTSPELNYAINSCGVQILTIENIIYWPKKRKVFESFVLAQKKLKMESSGAKRVFAKYLQNSLYGKFGMKRERIVYTDWTQEAQDKLRAKAQICAKVLTPLKPILKFRKLFFADYIRPQYAAFVTSYARLELLKMMKTQESKGNDIYYCDTDSLVLKEKMEDEFVDDKLYGMWALERELKKGIFLLPKLYAEISKGGEEICKSKGIIREYREKVKFSSYVNFYKKMIAGITVELYGDTGKKYYQRMKIIRSIQEGKKLNTRILLRKRFCFSSLDIFKRVFDFDKNESYPILLKEA